MTPANAIAGTLLYIKSKCLQATLIFVLVALFMGFDRGAIWWVESSYDIDIQNVSFEIDLLPYPSISFQQLEIIDKKREPQANPLLTAEQLELVMTHGSLLGGRPEFTLLQGKQLKLNLRSGDQSRFQSSTKTSSWDFPILGAFDLRSVDIHYREDTKSQPFRLLLDKVILPLEEDLQLTGSVNGTPVIFNSDVIIDAKQLSMPRWTLLANGQPVQGSLEYDTQGKQAQLNINIYSDEVHWAEADESIKSNPSPLLLSNELLPLDLLRNLDVNAEIFVKNLSSGILSFDNVRLPVNLESGVLKIGNASADFSGGNILAALMVDYKQGTRATWRAALDVRKARLSELPGLTDLGLQSAGYSSMLWEMQGYGRSSQEFLATSRGKLQVDLGEFLLENKVSDALGGDILLTLLDQFRPDTDEAEFMEFHCGAINLRIKDGKIAARKNIIIQTARVDVLGSIDVDLHNEKFSLSFNPIAQGGVGVNLNEYTSAAKIGGYLSQPKVQMNALETAKIGVGMWASANTGGASKLAQSLYKKIVNRNKSCHKILPSVDAPKFLFDVSAS